MTFTFADLLLLIIGAAVVVMMVILIRLSSQLMRTAQEVETAARHIHFMRPKIERLLEQAEAELSEISSITRKADHIAEDVNSVTHQLAHVALPAISGLATIAGPLRYAGAALTGAKIGVGVLRKRRRKHEDEDEE